MRHARRQQMLDQDVHREMEQRMVFVRINESISNIASTDWIELIDWRGNSGQYTLACHLYPRPHDTRTTVGNKLWRSIKEIRLVGYLYLKLCAFFIGDIDLNQTVGTNATLLKFWARCTRFIAHFFWGFFKKILSAFLCTLYQYFDLLVLKLAFSPFFFLLDK